MDSSNEPIQVRHPRYGVGTIVTDAGITAIVRFRHGIEECARDELEPALSIPQVINQSQWHFPLEVITRLQAEAIESINDTWGIFARSRIELLPHQLWVCRQVNKEWPTFWLVADDVGLGKTIEAGIILTPLIASGKARRILVICPASIVGQWQERLREMFDIRLAIYNPEADSKRADFWGTHNQVVVSLQTLRKDHSGRHERLLESDPWDLVIVDESHHLNTDEKQGPTLGYELIKKLRDYNLIHSMLFFTGTPHRGKDFGFIGQLQLLRPDLFDTKNEMVEQLHSLRKVMIRNNKYNVTDLSGNRLFSEPSVYPETYSYSEEESHFYVMLSDFIKSGKAYASSLSPTSRQAVGLILTTMQKLASSSVSSIRSALRNRLGNIKDRRENADTLEDLKNQYEEILINSDEADAADELARIEELIIENSGKLRLMEDEEESLLELLQAADAVQNETKIKTILDTIESRLQGRNVVMFTEYKATQSLIMSELIQRYGDDNVTFINGDSLAKKVTGKDGQVRDLRKQREDAASEFNSGKTRFLISTEAGGEGIDLQDSCHTIIHVDLPWNPMRLHQRVGRINRYGQTKKVEVFQFRNPDTVEAKILRLLEEKLASITTALSEVMEDPEDMLQLVLGMSSPGLFDKFFAEAPESEDEKLKNWFDKEAGTFGGQDVIETVKQIVGSVHKFEFAQVSDRLPRVDLQDLLQFFDSSLSSP